MYGNHDGRTRLFILISPVRCAVIVTTARQPSDISSSLLIKTSVWFGSRLRIFGAVKIGRIALQFVCRGGLLVGVVTVIWMHCRGNVVPEVSGPITSIYCFFATQLVDGDRECCLKVATIGVYCHRVGGTLGLQAIITTSCGLQAERLEESGRTPRRPAFWREGCTTSRFGLIVDIRARERTTYALGALCTLAASRVPRVWYPFLVSIGSVWRIEPVGSRRGRCPCLYGPLDLFTCRIVPRERRRIGGARLRSSTLRVRPGYNAICLHPFSAAQWGQPPWRGPDSTLRTVFKDQRTNVEEIKEKKNFDETRGSPLRLRPLEFYMQMEEGMAPVAEGVKEEEVRRSEEYLNGRVSLAGFFTVRVCLLFSVDLHVATAAPRQRRRACNRPVFLRKYVP
ncbi:hypothetical protein B0H19DRAFT_1069308 [Mycena capillaripes]|nr:hypothetical protein B0H19DRAFT_1069308 [Mycena capillaripes]